MIKSYFLVAFRALKRNKLHASINIIGLAIGMTCCILIALFVQFELGYDRQNKNANRIYRLAVDLEANNWAISAFPLGALLKENYPEVENYTRIKPVEVFMQNSSGALFKNKEKVFYADSTVFDVLDIRLIKGNPVTALAEVNSIVVTPEAAKAYFGDQDPIGKTLTMLGNKKEFVITGIFEPLPSNSHVHMNMMASSESFESMRADSKVGFNSLTNHYTYVVLPEGIDHLSFEKTISSFLDKYQNIQAGDDPNVIRLQPLTSIHLHSNRGLEIEANGNMNTVYTLSAIAFFILIIACINFMNLTTAQSLKRAREVGIRKVVGSQKRQLIFQFLSESVVISFLSLTLAIVLLTLIVPQFNFISGKEIVINPLKNSLIVFIFTGITLFVGLFAGTYPAFFLSSFKPSSVLKGNFIGNIGGQVLRKGLVVFQFAIAFLIMVGTYVVYSQLNYMLTKNMGFDREQTLVLTMPRDSVGDRSIKNEMARLAGVTSVTRFNEIPGKMVNTTNLWYEGVKDNQAENLYIFSGDADLLKTMGIKLKAGGYFGEDTQQFGKEFVINETALKHFGWKPEEAIGKLMEFGERGSEPGKVIGVIEDFHFKHLHDVIDPLVLYLNPHYEGRYMALKVNTNDMQAMVTAIEQKWKNLLPQYEFEYQFLDESFDRLFDQEKRLGQLFGIFSALAIFISCLGLFGLASFTMEQSRKAVAVRKVLGASVLNIVVMMSKSFLKLVLLGMLLAAPLAYFAATKWLQGFAYNVGFTWIVYIYAAFLAMFVAFATVSYHSLKTARTNPVNALKAQ
ncbi:ABC transporter permease [Fulvivirgaceae bacterium PWU5]|uniref:ABC transporter permease n=1 Tax=Dawidia cretensis TaxID=2782350 RepID=A0AAP2E322_9BACT|nr:ABC transporter permease [Dawidia cretensis]MBT1712145.1 ABC transporter permease [Dawidia cretensis]